jgi:branched-chain amino acid transport system substrate-binding protein
MRAVLMGLGLVAIAGCSATRFQHEECRDDGQCRRAFGFGATCGGQGLCEPARATARCATAFPEDLFSRPDGYRDAIVVGSLMDRSSPAHVVREKAVRLAVKEAAVSKLEGRPLAAVFCDIAQKTEYDGLTRTQAAVESGKLLAKLGVAAIIGPSASADAEQVWNAVRGLGTVVISPAATSPSLVALEPESSDGKPGLLWRVAPPDSLQGIVIADDVLSRGKEVAVIRESGAYGEGLAQVFQERFTAAGGKATILSLTSETQIGETAVMAAGQAPEILFISSQQNWIIAFLNAANGQPAYQQKRIFLTDGAANQAVLAATPAAMFPRIRGTRPSPRVLKDYVFASFVANYAAQYPAAAVR